MTKSLTVFLGLAALAACSKPLHIPGIPAPATCHPSMPALC